MAASRQLSYQMRCNTLWGKVRFWLSQCVHQETRIAFQESSSAKAGSLFLQKFEPYKHSAEIVSDPTSECHATNNDD